MDKTSGLVVFFSRTGNTEKVAKAIAEIGGHDITKLREKGVNRDGIMGYITAGRDGMLKRKSELEPIDADACDYDTLFIGTPVWGFDLVPAVRAYLSSVDLSDKKVGLFCTMGGSGDKRAFASMAELAKGADIIGKLALTEGQVKEDVQEAVKNWISGLA